MNPIISNQNINICGTRIKSYHLGLSIYILKCNHNFHRSLSLSHSPWKVRHHCFASSQSHSILLPSSWCLTHDTNQTNWAHFFFDFFFVYAKHQLPRVTWIVFFSSLLWWSTQQPKTIGSEVFEVGSSIMKKQTTRKKKRCIEGGLRLHRVS